MSDITYTRGELIDDGVSPNVTVTAFSEDHGTVQVTVPRAQVGDVSTDAAILRAFETKGDSADAANAD